MPHRQSLKRKGVCHSERSQESLTYFLALLCRNLKSEMFRFAQHDNLRERSANSERGRSSTNAYTSSGPTTKWITPFGAEMKKPLKSSRNCSTSSRRETP